MVAAVARRPRSHRCTDAAATALPCAWSSALPPHLLSGHGESFESNPNECIGNNGYQPPMRLPTIFILAIDSSAPPRPWLCSKPTHFCHTIITRLRPIKSPVCASSANGSGFVCFSAQPVVRYLCIRTKCAYLILQRLLVDRFGRVPNHARLLLLPQPVAVLHVAFHVRVGQCFTVGRHNVPGAYDLHALQCTSCVLYSVVWKNCLCAPLTSTSTVPFTFDRPSFSSPYRSDVSL